MDKPKKGLILINTGNGKGKTTAAFGTAMRMLGHGGRVCIVQFIKADKPYGEITAAGKLENLEVHTMGKGFVRPEHGDVSSDKAAARKALSFAGDKLASGDYDLVVLDEITYLPALKFADVGEIVDIINNRAEHTHVFLTGRNAPPELVSLADMVTETTEVKHPYNEGIKARKGIEF